MIEPRITPFTNVPPNRTVALNDLAEQYRKQGYVVEIVGDCVNIKGYFREGEVLPLQGSEEP